MTYRILAGCIVGFVLTASLTSVNCGGDDDPVPTGSAGSAGKAGAGGSGGTAGTSGTAGTGGTGGTGTAGSAGAGTGGTAGGGTAGTGGSAGAGGQREGGTDAPTTDGANDGSLSEGAAPDASSGDAPDGAVAFSSVRAILSVRCTGCHRPRDAGTQLIDFLTDAGLYDRLTAPLPDNQEGICGFGDAGNDGGDAAPENRRPIVPGDPGASFLYLKVTGTQPAGCGQRMPRRPVIGEDGGPAGTTGCNLADGGAEANCLSQTDLDIILHWIEQGAPNN